MSTTIDTVQEVHRIVPTPDGYRVERREYRTSEYEQGGTVVRTQQWTYEIYNRYGQLESGPAAPSVNINT
jgi:hypothetical protein